MFDLILSLLFGLFLVASIVSIGRQWWLRYRRLRLIHDLERARGSRVIALIHRQERLSLLGIPILRYIDIDDAEKILRVIHATPSEKAIDLILHTPGGLRLSAQQIAYALRQHRGPVSVMIPHYAMSGGTLIALAADKVVMDTNAILGSSDVQIPHNGQSVPATAVMAVLRQKPLEKIDDQTLMLAHVASKGQDEMCEVARYLLERSNSPERSAEIASALTSGRWSHDYPLPVPALREIGLLISTELPKQVYELMELYPQPGGATPNVEFVPRR